jgi:peptidoglycan/xylan/chitin deacetylase (PgdA/CDA1 family)
MMDWIRRQHKDIVKKGLYYSGYYSLRAANRKPERNRLLILMYHDLSEDYVDANDWISCLNPRRSEFAAHLKCIQRRFRVMSVEEAVDEIQQSGLLKHPSVAITFDDGYASVYHIALPILKKYGFTATVYLATDWIDGSIMPWWLSLADFMGERDFAGEGWQELGSLLQIRSTDFKKASEDSTVLGQLYLRIQSHLREMRETDQTRLLNQLAGSTMDRARSSSITQTALNWRQVKEMHGAGIRFGAHTCTHLNLKHASIDVAETEIVNSKKRLEEHLGKEVVGFAYPYGKDLQTYQQIRPILTKYCFRYACSGHHGNNDCRSDPFMLCRTTLPSTLSTGLIGRALWVDYLDDNSTPER